MEDLECILNVMGYAWSESTLETYGTALLAWQVYCDLKNIPEQQRSPASSILITSFLSNFAGIYSNKTLHNYVYSLQAWHVLHGIPWVMEDKEINTMLKATEKLTPITSKRKKHCPYTPDFITALEQDLNLDCPLNAAFFACLTTCFYAAACLGEFTVCYLDAFDPALHVTTANLSIQ